MRTCVNLVESGLRLAYAEFVYESDERVAKTLKMMRECPHVVVLGPFRDSPDTLFGLYALPEDGLWWLEMVADNPSIVRAKSVRVVALAPSLPEEVWLDVRAAEGDPPCGSACDTCPSYRNKCGGCPSSRYHAAAGDCTE